MEEMIHTRLGVALSDGAPIGGGSRRCLLTHHGPGLARPWSNVHPAVSAMTCAADGLKFAGQVFGRLREELGQRIEELTALNSRIHLQTGQ